MDILKTVLPYLTRDVLEPLVLILLGGAFVFAEASLVAKKESFKKSSSLLHLRLGLRLAAVFFFVLSTILEVENMSHFLGSLSFLSYSFTILLLTLVLSLGVLLLGVLVPRSLGERSYAVVSRFRSTPLFKTLLKWISPISWLLEKITSLLLKLFGFSFHEESSASDEEVIQMMDEGLVQGVFNVSEKTMVEGVLELDEECASSLMTPRSHLVWLNIDEEEEVNWRAIAKSGHSEFPVFQGTHDHILGLVSVKSLWANLSLAGAVKLPDVVAPALYVPSTMQASKLIEEFRSKKRYTALVVDEFGVVEGIVTLKDVIESIMGVLPERQVKQHYPKIVERGYKTWKVDALTDFEEVCETVGFLKPEDKEEEKRYQTIGGFFLHHLGHIPQEGESLLWGDFKLEVLKMKKHRIERLKITKIKSNREKK